MVQLLTLQSQTGLIFTKLSGLVVLWEGFIKHAFILRSLKECSMATNFVATFAKMADPTLIRHASISKWIPGSQF